MTYSWNNVSCAIPAQHHCPNPMILCSNSGIYEWLLLPLISNHFLLFIYFFFHVVLVIRDWSWGPYICWSWTEKNTNKKSSHDQQSKTITYRRFYFDLKDFICRKHIKRVHPISLASLLGIIMVLLYRVHLYLLWLLVICHALFSPLSMFRLRFDFFFSFLSK